MNEMPIVSYKGKPQNEQSKKLTRIITILTFLLFIITGMTIGGVAYLSSLPSIESPIPLQVERIPIYVDLLPVGISGYIGQEMKIKHIVVHETGNPRVGSDAAAHNEYIHKAAQKTPISWHYTVDDHQIYKHLPDNQVGFHAGDKFKQGGGNMNGIGIEMCVNADGNFEQTLQNTAALIRYLMKEYELTIYDVKKHQDFSGKTCPETLILTGRWEEFLNMIEEPPKPY